MKRLLEGLMQGLALWLYGLILEIVEFIADSLLQVFNMNLAYFEANVPVTKEIVNIIIVAGWALLIGNLVFQAMKSMMSGIGFEGEDPKILFCRTFVFSFLLLASRQICEIGLGMTSQLNTMLKTPDAVKLNLPPLDIFAIQGSWLLVMLIGIILIVQIVKFFFEIAERYVVLVMLTILAPLAFGMGGSKNTEDIFKGWARMFGSACLMMLFNTVFLKLLLSAMNQMPSTFGMFPWLLLVVAIIRVARKIDEMAARIGLNVARTGDPIGRGGIMYPIMVAKALGGIVSKTASVGKGSSHGPSSGRQSGDGAASSPSSPPPSSGPVSGGGAPNQPRQGGGGNAAPSGTGTQPPAPAGQPSMSTEATGGGKEPPPSRPPVGVGWNPSRPDSYRDDERDTADLRRTGSNKPPLSADSASPGGVSPQPHESGAAERMPPLSVDSRRPDIPGAKGQKPGMDFAGTSPAAVEGAKPPQRYRPNKPVNIDIYRDDDPADGLHPAGGQRPASVNQSRSPVTPGQASQTSGGSQAVLHTDKRSTRITNNAEESTRNMANTANPPPGASSPGTGRIGGTTVPGGENRPASAMPTPRHTRPVGSAPDSPQPRPATAETRSAGRSTYSARRAPSTTGGNQSAVHPADSSRRMEKPGAAQGSRPTRYRRVESKPRQQPQNAANQEPGQANARPAPGRPMPGKPGISGQSPGRGPAARGGNRP